MNPGITLRRPVEDANTFRVRLDAFPSAFPTERWCRDHCTRGHEGLPKYDIIAAGAYYTGCVPLSTPDAEGVFKVGFESMTPPLDIPGLKP